MAEKRKPRKETMKIKDLISEEQLNEFMDKEDKVDVKSEIGLNTYIDEDGHERFVKDN